MKYFGFAKQEYKFLKSLKTPARIQDFVDKIPYNQEKKKETCYSPKYVLKLNTANCIEGAVFAAAALRDNGFKPLILDLESDPKLDDDHVIAVFQVKGYWGAIGKSKFTGLTYRNAVYKSVRELVMSYFDDYYNEDGKMSLRKYSVPVNLSRFDKAWLGIIEQIDKIFCFILFLYE